MLVAADNRNLDEAGDAERLGSVSLICCRLIGLEKTFGLVCHNTHGL